jgi:hypothetical protein
MAGDRNARNSITYVLKLWDFRWKDERK